MYLIVTYCVTIIATLFDVISLGLFYILWQSIEIMSHNAAVPLLTLLTFL